MIISLLGYMGSGKSHVAKSLAEKLSKKNIDLDDEISFRLNLSIPEIFNQKGEIYFRKQERMVLQELLHTENDIVLSLGGGTPCYYDNIELINQHTESIFLLTSGQILAQRILKEKETRPLLARITPDELPEYIAKHLFERNSFYSKAKHVINTDNLSADKVAEEIIRLLPHHLPD